MNREGKVKGIFTNMIHSPFTGCPFLLGRKLDFFTEETQSNQINDWGAVEELMFSEQYKMVELAMNGDMDAMFELLGKKEFGFFDFFREAKEAILSDHLLIQHIFVDITMMEYLTTEGELDNILQDIIKMITERLTSSKPQDILPVTWYIKGFVDYYIHGDLETACEFWSRARQAGHPFVFQDFVIVPDEADIISCKF